MRGLEIHPILWKDSNSKTLWELVKTAVGDIQQQFQNLTTSLNGLKIDNAQERISIPDASVDIKQDINPVEKDTPPHLKEEEKVEVSAKSEGKFTEGEQKPIIVDMPNQLTNFRKTTSMVDMPNQHTNFKNFPKTSA